MLGHAPLSTVPLSAVPAAGAAVPKLSGYTRNRCSVVEPGCSVRLFSAATHALVDSTTSNGVGYYEFLNPVGSPFYAAAFSADGTLAGVTAPTLVPS